jgi:hypothetical protein
MTLNMTQRWLFKTGWLLYIYVLPISTLKTASCSESLFMASWLPYNGPLFHETEWPAGLT